MSEASFHRWPRLEAISMIFGRLALLQSFASYLLTYCSLNMSDQPHVIVEIVLLSFDALLSRRPLIKAQGVIDVI